MKLLHPHDFESAMSLLSAATNTLKHLEKPSPDDITRVRQQLINLHNTLLRWEA